MKARLNYWKGSVILLVLLSAGCKTLEKSRAWKQINKSSVRIIDAADRDASEIIEKSTDSVINKTNEYAN